MTDTTTEFPDTDESTLLGADDVMQTAGCTYRQLDYWTREGHVTAQRPPLSRKRAAVAERKVRRGNGSGRPRLWAAGDVETIRRATLAAQALPGIPADLMFQLARSTQPLTLGDGIVVTTPWSET